MYIHVPVLILFFNITIYGPKHHILACVQPAGEQIEATFGSKFWPVYLANSGLRSKITVEGYDRVFSIRYMGQIYACIKVRNIMNIFFSQPRLQQK